MNGKITQGFLDFTRPSAVPISHIDTRGWRRVSTVTGRCRLDCASCICVSDLQKLAQSANIETIAFNESGSPVLTSNQLTALRSRQESVIPNEIADTLDIVVSVPPPPLKQTCSDDKL